MAPHIGSGSLNVSDANLQRLASHMGVRNIPCMRNSQSVKSWGSICGNRARFRHISAAVGGPCAGLMSEHVSGCTCLLERLSVAEQDGWGNSRLESVFTF